MDKKLYYKWLFIIAAIHAWLLSVPFYIISFIESPYVGENLYFFQLAMGAVILFALGYFIVGLNIEKNHGIVLMGILGKFLVFISITAYYFQGFFTIFEVIVGISDLILAILYIEFLVNYKKL